jgi:dTDP-4-dehydrorhamnose reductase
MKKVLITGGSGQLGQCLQTIATNSIGFEFVFFNSKELDITSKESIISRFDDTFDFCINCAAYTAVDKAEEEQKKKPI